jgi:hypothetical protein
MRLVSLLLPVMKKVCRLADDACACLLLPCNENIYRDYLETIWYI